MLLQVKQMLRQSRLLLYTKPEWSCALPRTVAVSFRLL